MERNSEVSADAIERESKAEAFSLELSSIALNILPFAALCCGVVLLLADKDIGGYVALIAGISTLAAQAWRRLRS